jgi:hypothetical protein
MAWTLGDQSWGSVLETDADSNEEPAIRPEDGNDRPLSLNNSDLKTVNEEQSVDQAINRKHSQ